MTIRADDITPDTPDRRVTRAVLAALEARDMSRIELQRRVHAGEGWVSARLRGKTKWTVDDVARVGVALGIDPAALLAGHERWD